MEERKWSYLKKEGKRGGEFKLDRRVRRSRERERVQNRGGRSKLLSQVQEKGGKENWNCHRKCKE